MSRSHTARSFTLGFAPLPRLRTTQNPHHAGPFAALTLHIIPVLNCTPLQSFVPHKAHAVRFCCGSRQWTRPSHRTRIEPALDLHLFVFQSRRGARANCVCFWRRCYVLRVGARVYNTAMAIFLGHISALTFWRSGFLPNDFGSSRARPPEKPVCRKEIITAARELLNLCRNPPTTHILRRNEMPFPTADVRTFGSCGRFQGSRVRNQVCFA